MKWERRQRRTGEEKRGEDQNENRKGTELWDECQGMGWGGGGGKARNGKEDFATVSPCRVGQGMRLVVTATKLLSPNFVTFPVLTLFFSIFSIFPFLQKRCFCSPCVPLLVYPLHPFGGIIDGSSPSGRCTTCDKRQARAWRRYSRPLCFSSPAHCAVHRNFTIRTSLVLIVNFYFTGRR